MYYIIIQVINYYDSTPNIIYLHNISINNSVILTDTARRFMVLSGLIMNYTT